jgi:hypothetical protein
MPLTACVSNPAGNGKGVATLAKNNLSPVSTRRGAKEEKMRKYQSLLIAILMVIAALALPVSAQGPNEYPVRTEFAVFQSMDSGDPHSVTLLIAQEKTVGPQHMIAILADPMQLINLEHPLGAKGMISGEYIVFDPSMTFEEAILVAEEMVPAEAEMVYAGSEALSNDSLWDNTYGVYWTITVRYEEEETIEVPDAVWTWETLPLSNIAVTCPDTASLCLYQSWDGLDGGRAWHIAMEPATEFSPIFPLEGTFYIITGVKPTNMETLIARFDQMRRTVLVRDENEVGMIVYRIWEGKPENAPEGWVFRGGFNWGPFILPSDGTTNDELESFKSHDGLKNLQDSEAKG